MRILFASGSMLGGGAERVVSLLANYLVAHGFDVYILIVRGDSVYPLDSRIRLVRIYQEHEITSKISNKIWRRLVYLQRIVGRLIDCKPEVVIPVHGGGWNALFTVLSKAMMIKVVASEHITHTINSKRFLRFVERRLIYRLADAVTVLTKSDQCYYASFLRRVVRIPNPVSFMPVTSIGMRESLLLSAGRLDSWPHKGFDNLLRVFAALSEAHPEWRLQIAGGGERGMNFLVELAKDLGIEKKVDFLGFQSEIQQVMQRAAIFVVSSRFEGFSMVLLEAMSQGCACVSFDCKAGPSDIIEPNVDGILIEDQNVIAMQRELDALMRDQDRIRALASEAIKKPEQFSLERVGGAWINLLNSVSATR